MKIQPMKRYNAPHFPTRAILDTHPELLRLAPRRWQTHPAVLTALAAASLITLTRWAYADQNNPQENARVAPIFEHGSGDAAFGCMTINPPVFLSEAEGRQVIIDEAKKLGVNFTQEGMVLHDVRVPIIRYDYPTFDPSYMQRRIVTLDGVNAGHAIAFEYVSLLDCHNWRFRSIKPKMSVYGVEPIDAARGLQFGLSQVKAQPYIGVFYDPIPYTSDVKADLLEKETRLSCLLVGDVLLAPVDTVAEWLGATTTRDQKDRICITRKGKELLVLTLGSDQLTLEGERMRLPARIVEIDGAVYTPANLLAVLLGAREVIAREYSLRIVHPQNNAYLVLIAGGRLTDEGISPLNLPEEPATPEDRERLYQFTKSHARELLRQQVRDFIGWLKAQGAI